jgi:predicted Rossmann fold nucleotide-binding protein DprA/Smf involved in DNA uptake
LKVVERSSVEPEAPLSSTQRVRQALAQVHEPIPVQQLQKLCGIRTAKICSALAELATQGEVVRDARGYQLKLPLPVSRPIAPQGNGNGKRSDFVQ